MSRPQMSVECQERLILKENMDRRAIGLRLHHRMCGLGRARFWRSLGFPNLVRARAALAAKRDRERAQRAARAFSPFADAREFSRKP